VLNYLSPKNWVKRTKCRHDKVLPGSIETFCPDCGKEIIIYWYITRCGCCYTKRLAVLSADNVIPVYKYCTKCGSSQFFVEKKEKLNFYDIDYAILIREEIGKRSDFDFKTQIWIEGDNGKRSTSPKLLTVN